MTVIVGIASKGKVYMAGDSARTNGWGELSTPANKKVFVRGNFLFGVAGSARASDLLQYRFEAPTPQTNDIDEYMMTDFVDALRECFQNGGIGEKENGVESVHAVVLIGIMGRLYNLHGGDYQVAKSACGYDAIGTGGQLALGSLYSTQKKSPQVRIQLALEAAQEYMSSVRGPFLMEKI